MTAALSSIRHEVSDFSAAIEFAHEAGWTDGLPIVPPTEESVMRFIEATRCDPGFVIGVVEERSTSITVEKLAINAVLAGCLPDYMPILVAAVEGVTDKRFKFNHLASLGSPWPLIVVNGPIAKKLEINSGSYLFGGGQRANATIARALSLVLRNCAGAKVEDVQRGQWGNPVRMVGCMAENEETSWEPLHVQRGFEREESTVTVVPTCPGSLAHIRMVGGRPERLLDIVCYAFTHWGGAEWVRGTYTLLLGPHMADIFLREGWTKDDIRSYITHNARVSIATLKRRGTWGKTITTPPSDLLEIQPGDEQELLYLFKDGPYDDYVFHREWNEDHDADVFVLVAGGDAGPRMEFTVPYQLASNPVTKAIKSNVE